MKPTIEDYKPEHRLYTGLYSAKAFNLIAKCVLKYNRNVIIGYTIRSPDNECVVCQGSIKMYTPTSTGLVETSPDTIRDSLVHWLKELADNPNESDHDARIARAVCKYLSRDTLMEDECAKLIRKLVGRPLDPVSAELTSCLAAETRRIESEHANFSAAVDRAYYVSPSEFRKAMTITLMPDENDLSFSHVDQAELREMNRLRHAMLVANNALAAAVEDYGRTYAAYCSERNKIKKLSRLERDRRLKELKSEFGPAKRTGPRKENTIKA